MSVPDDWWRLACEKIPHGLACVAPNGSFRWANQHFCRIVGYSLVELLAMRWHDLTDLNDIGGDEQSVQQVLKGLTEDYFLTKKYKRRDGSKVDIELYVHRFPEVGEVTLLLAAIEETDMAHIEALRAELQNEVKKLREEFLRTHAPPTNLLTLWPKEHSVKTIGIILLILYAILSAIF